MRRTLGCWLVLVLCAAPVRADEPAGKLVQDLWEAVYLEGGKVGFSHTSVREIERGKQKILRTATELDMTVKRYNALARLRMETGTEETLEGKVVGVFMKQYLDMGKQLVLTGTVEGGHLLVRVNGGRQDKKVRWNEGVVGLYRQQRLFQERKVKPGDQFHYLSYEPSINAMVTVRIVVKGHEEVELLGGKKERLLRVEAVPDKIEVPGESLQLPGMSIWLDEKLETVRSQTELPWIGKLISYRTTREVATRPGGPAPKLDIGTAADITLNRTIPNPHGVKAVVYGITFKGDDDPKSVLTQDARQQIRNAQGNRFELHVQAVRRPEPGRKEEVKDEYLKSNYFINCDDARVKELARKASGAETDPWKKAQAIERWVHNNMRGSSAVEFTTADQVAKNLAGDCRQHAVLTAALCRAAGVPARTALGLVYVPKQRPVMGFHMWTEVFAEGQWLGLDATLGRGSVGAAHIKIADHSWHNTESLTPMLPVLRVLGKLAIEVVRVEGKE